MSAFPQIAKLSIEKKCFAPLKCSHRHFELFIVQCPSLGNYCLAHSTMTFQACNLAMSVVAERSSALDSSCDVVRMWVRIPAWPVTVLVSLSKTLYQNCFVLRMRCKAVGPVCCVMHVKEPRTLIVKEKGLAPVFLDSRLEHPAG